MLSLRFPAACVIVAAASTAHAQALRQYDLPAGRLDVALTQIARIAGAVISFRADLVAGKADVIVTDAFAGNVALKMYEATGKALLGLMKEGFKANLASKLGAALAIGPLKKKLKKFDASRYGGAPMLGLNGLVVKSHGSAKAVEIKNTMLQCIEFSRQDIPGKIQAALGKEKA